MGPVVTFVIEGMAVRSENKVLSTSHDRRRSKFPTFAVILGSGSDSSDKKGQAGLSHHMLKSIKGRRGRSWRRTGPEDMDEERSEKNR